MTQKNVDVHVFHRDSLDEEFANNFSKPWLVQYVDGTVKEFETEDLACAFQRVHRSRNGLNPITGEII